jgi:hypothetical protein
MSMYLKYIEDRKRMAASRPVPTPGTRELLRGRQRQAMKENTQRRMRSVMKRKTTIVRRPVEEEEEEEEKEDEEQEHKNGE